MQLFDVEAKVGFYSLFQVGILAELLDESEAITCVEFDAKNEGVGIHDECDDSVFTVKLGGVVHNMLLTSTYYGGNSGTFKLKLYSIGDKNLTLVSEGDVGEKYHLKVKGNCLIINDSFDYPNSCFFNESRDISKQHQLVIKESKESFLNKFPRVDNFNGNYLLASKDGKVQIHFIGKDLSYSYSLDELKKEIIKHGFSNIDSDLYFPGTWKLEETYKASGLKVDFKNSFIIWFQVYLIGDPRCCPSSVIFSIDKKDGSFLQVALFNESTRPQ